MKQITKDKILVYGIDLVKFLLSMIVGSFIGRGIVILYNNPMNSSLNQFDWAAMYVTFVSAVLLLMYIGGNLSLGLIALLEKYNRAKENIRYHKDGRLR